MGGRVAVVFVIDDDLAVRESLKFALELEGMAVRICASGAELLRHPDLVEASCLVLDDKMPGMGGFEVMERLLARDLRLPIILITSCATPAFCRRATAAGATHVLEKPLLDTALTNRLHGILGLPQGLPGA